MDKCLYWLFCQQYTKAFKIFPDKKVVKGLFNLCHVGKEHGQAVSCSTTNTHQTPLMF